MFGLKSTADRLSIGDQADRGAWLQVIEIVVCGFIGHRTGVLHYDTFELVEQFDPEEGDWADYARDVRVPYLGCLRCLAEVEIHLPPPVPVDIVDWK